MRVTWWPLNKLPNYQYTVQNYVTVFWKICDNISSMVTLTSSIMPSLTG